MSAEVITMEEFYDSKVEKVESMGPLSEEELNEDLDWAMKHSYDMVHLAGNTVRVLLLIHNIVEDTLLHCKELPEVDLEEVKASFQEYVNSGIKAFETPCPECGE